MLSVQPCHALAEIVICCIPVTGGNANSAVIGADIVEDEISARGPVISPATDTDSLAVALTQIRYDRIASRVALNLLVPDMDSRAAIS